MTVWIMSIDEHGNPVEVYGETDDLKLFGTIPETKPDESDNNGQSGKESQ